MKHIKNNKSTKTKTQDYLKNKGRESVKTIIEDHKHHFKQNKINFRIMISPKDYPSNEDLIPYPDKFEEFFNKLRNGEFQDNNCNQNNQFFDPSAFTISNYNFEKPIIYIISKSDQFPNSMIIKRDGVIYYNYHQNVKLNGKVVIDIEQLSKFLAILFNCFILKIYNEMKYKDKLKLEIYIFNLTNCSIKDKKNFEQLKSLKISSESYERSFILKFEDISLAYRRILADIRSLFQ